MRLLCCVLPSRGLGVFAGLRKTFCWCVLLVLWQALTSKTQQWTAVAISSRCMTLCKQMSPAIIAG